MSSRDEFREIWGPGGLRQRAHFRTDKSDEQMQACVDLVGRRIAQTLGVAIEGWGRLEEAFAGHPEDTAFVEISADCLDERTSARRALRDIAGLTDLAWDYGWENATITGRPKLVLRVFPNT
jgi:hypothetical protein